MSTLWCAYFVDMQIGTSQVISRYVYQQIDRFGWCATSLIIMRKGNEVRDPGIHAYTRVQSLYELIVGYWRGMHYKLIIMCKGNGMQDPRIHAHTII